MGNEQRIPKKASGNKEGERKIYLHLYPVPQKGKSLRRYRISPNRGEEGPKTRRTSPVFTVPRIKTIR